MGNKTSTQSGTTNIRRQATTPTSMEQQSSTSNLAFDASPPPTPQGRQTTFQTSPNFQRSISSPVITPRPTEYLERQDTLGEVTERLDIEENEENDQIIVKRKDEDGENLTLDDYINKYSYWSGNQDSIQELWEELDPSDDQGDELTIDQKIENWKAELKKNMCGSFNAMCTNTVFDIKVTNKKLGPNKNYGPFTKDQFIVYAKTADENGKFPYVRNTDNFINLMWSGKETHLKTTIKVNSLYVKRETDKGVLNKSEYIKLIGKDGLPGSKSARNKKLEEYGKNWESFPLKEPKILAPINESETLQNAIEEAIETPMLGIPKSPLKTPTKEEYKQDNMERKKRDVSNYESEHDHLYTLIRKYEGKCFVSLNKNENITEKSKYVYSKTSSEKNLFNIFHLQGTEEIDINTKEGEEEDFILNLELKHIQNNKETLNKILENNGMDNNIYLSDINLLGILDEKQKIKIILIDSVELQTQGDGDEGNPSVIVKCNYRDFNTEKKGKFINTGGSEEQKISILTTENIQSLENYLEKDLIDSLNKFDLTPQSRAGRKKTQKYKQKKINTRKNKQPKRNK